MAIYTVNNLLSTGDVIRTTRRYSSAQSLNLAGKNGHTHVTKIGRMHFTWEMPDKVQAFYQIATWEGLNVIGYQQLAAGLSPLSKISKKIKTGETVVLGWGLLNRIDVYWIAGSFFANEHAAAQIAHSEKTRIASFTIPPKVRKKRRYLS